MFDKFQINTLVNFGFILMIVLFASMTAISHQHISKIEEDSERVITLRAPTVKAVSSVNIALNQSLAALRGWVLIGEDRFVSTRQDAWQSIRHEYDVLEALSIDWTNPENKKRLKQASVLLDQLEKEQLSIELIAHKSENIHAYDVLIKQAAPLALSITTSITTLVDYSRLRKATDQRLSILAEMADFRGSFALSLADIRAFLLSGDDRFKKSFESHWVKNQESLDNLYKLSKHMMPFEKSKLDEIKVLKERFDPLPEVMLTSRLGQDWNQANYLLKTTAVLTSNKLVSIFKLMVADQNILLAEDAQLLGEEVAALKLFQLAFLAFSLIVILFLSSVINRKYRVFSSNLKSRNSLVDQNVLIAELNQSGDITRISNALCRCLGGVQEDFIGNKSHFFIPEDGNDGLFEAITKSLQTGQSWQGEFKRYHQDGTEIWLSSSIFPVNEVVTGERVFHNILEDITNRKLLEEVSVTDTLTSLYNRRKFDEVIEQEIKIANRRKQSITLAIIDIDFFKNYNDHYGHPGGDGVLKRTSAAIKSCFFRPDDYVFRLGGEEFGILFSGLNEEESFEILEKVRESIEQLKIEHVESSVSDYLSISIGAKVSFAGEMIDKDHLYNDADRFLYEAKEKRNFVVIG